MVLLKVICTIGSPAALEPVASQPAARGQPPSSKPAISQPSCLKAVEELGWKLCGPADVAAKRWDVAWADCPAALFAAVATSAVATHQRVARRARRGERAGR